MAHLQQPRGIRNNNPLNIRKGNAFLGERHPQTDPAFEEFKTLELGLRAGFVTLHSYLKRRDRINTISRIISRWAPSNENNTVSYIRTVADRSGINPDAPIKWEEKNKLCRIVAAMCWVECGQEISFGRIENAYELAKITDPKRLGL